MFLTVIEKPLSTVDTTARYTPGCRYVDEKGNEYIYALGVASTVAGSWVALSLETTNNTPITALLNKTVADYGTSVAVAMGIFVASTYGWYQVKGTVEACALTLDAADAIQYTSGTDGYLDDDATTQTKIRGVRLVDTATDTNLYTFIINHPRSAA